MVTSRRPRWANWTTLDAPGATDTLVVGNDGSTLVGYYSDNDGSTWHGFVHEVPEPATFLLLGVGTMILSRKRRNRA